MMLAKPFRSDDAHDQPSATNRDAAQYIADKVHTEVDPTPRNRYDGTHRNRVRDGFCSRSAVRCSTEYVRQHSEAHERSDDMTAGETEGGAVQKVFGTQWAWVMDRALGDLDDQRRTAECGEWPGWSARTCR